MARKSPPFTPEFRRQMIELVRSGRSPESLAKEFEPTAQTIRNWVAQAGRDGGTRDDGSTSADRDEINRLRRENRQLKVERDILSIGEPEHDMGWGPMSRRTPGSLGRRM